MQIGIEITVLHALAGGQGADFEELIQKAAARNIRIKRVTRADLDRIAPGASHQGIIAEYIPLRTRSLAELLGLLEKETTAAIMILDGIQDPHNFGAVIRSAEVLGAGGVVYRIRRAAGLTPATVKASAGAALRLPLVEVSNIDATIRTLKAQDWWIYGLDPQGEISTWDVDWTGRTAIVLGGEGEGLAALTRRRCDRLVRIPQAGRIGSLNVSVAAALALGEWLRKTGTVK